MKAVKIYGERNTGTNFLTRLIRRNFLCELVPGTLVEARPGSRDSFEQEIAATIGDATKRMFARQIKLDEFFRGNVWTTLGWKHCVPPIEAIRSHPEGPNIVFVTVTKNPYAWVLSLFRRPYDSVSPARPNNLLSFINEPWVAGERDNTPLILSSPVELWNLKVEGYERLGRVATVVHVRYEDVLNNPTQFLERISEHLEPRGTSFHVPMASTKEDDVGAKDFEYYRDYYVKERWRESLGDVHIRGINGFLAFDVVRWANYAPIEPEGSV